MERLVWRSK